MARRTAGARAMQSVARMQARARAAAMQAPPARASQALGPGRCSVPQQRAAPMDDSLRAAFTALPHGAEPPQAGAPAAEAMQFLALLRQRFTQRGGGSQFHNLKVEIAQLHREAHCDDSCEQAYAGVSLLLFALGSPGGAPEAADALPAAADDDAGDGGRSQHTATPNEPVAAEPAPALAPEPQPQPAETAKARRWQRLQAARAAQTRSPASDAAAATPLALILLESLPSVSMHSPPQQLAAAVRHGWPLLAAIFRGELPLIRPRVVLRIVDVFGLAESGPPPPTNGSGGSPQSTAVHNEPGADVVTTPVRNSGNGRMTRWRRPLESGALLQWPSAIWGADSPSNTGTATPQLSHANVGDNDVAAAAPAAVTVGAQYLARLWREQREEATKTVALLLAFPSACAKACQLVTEQQQEPQANAKGPGSSSISSARAATALPCVSLAEQVLTALLHTRQWAALRQLLRAAPFSGRHLHTTAPTPAIHALRVQAVRLVLGGGFAPQAEALVDEFDLQADFPHVADGAQRGTLRRLLQQEQWQLAIDLAGAHVETRRWLLFELATGGGGNHTPQPELALSLAQSEVFGGTLIHDTTDSAALASVNEGAASVAAGDSCTSKLVAEVEAAIATSKRQRQSRRGDRGSTLSRNGKHDSNMGEDDDDELGVGGGASAYLELPLPGDRLHFVADLQGVERATTLLLGVNSVSSSGEENKDGPVVIGLDAEWRPDGRAHRQLPKQSSITNVTDAGVNSGGIGGESPVSILQLATREHAVVLDLVALLRPRETVLARCLSLAGSNTATAASSSSDPDSSIYNNAELELTPTEAAVNSLLSAILTGLQEGGPIAIGFCFSGDLARLARSYPQLPCFSLHRYLSAPLHTSLRTTKEENMSVTDCNLPTTLSRAKFACPETPALFIVAGTGRWWWTRCPWRSSCAARSWRPREPRAARGMWGWGQSCAPRSAVPPTCLPARPSVLNRF
eukprot:COSAG05_NODE_1289_length_5268_cov_4.125943_2_plen_973_part_00